MTAKGSTILLGPPASQPPQGTAPQGGAATPEVRTHAGDPNNAPPPPRKTRLTARIYTGGIAPRKPEVVPGPLGTHKMRTRSRVCKRALSNSWWNCKQCICWESFEML